MTDDETAEALVAWDEGIKMETIRADNAEPKSIKYYRKRGFNMRPCLKKCDKKTEGSRLANTKKIKRFKRIICSSSCKNSIREMKDLTYKKNHDGSMNYSQFNIDPHTLSAIWYAIDDYIVVDLKERKINSKKGV